MADKILKELTLKIWRQKDAKSKGEFKTYKVHNILLALHFWKCSIFSTNSW